MPIIIVFDGLNAVCFFSVFYHVYLALAKRVHKGKILYLWVCLFIKVHNNGLFICTNVNSLFS